MNQLLKYNPKSTHAKKIKMYMLYDAIKNKQLTEDEMDKYRTEFKCLESEVGRIQKINNAPKFNNPPVLTPIQKRMAWTHN